MRPETKAAVEEAARKLDELRRRAHEEHINDLRALPLLNRLVFAAFARCQCGAGLAYDPADDKSNFWDCSAIILGKAVLSGQPGAVTHTDRLPFAFYEIKSENQPSANGATTRPRG